MSGGAKISLPSRSAGVATRSEFHAPSKSINEVDQSRFGQQFEVLINLKKPSEDERSFDRAKGSRSEQDLRLLRR
jgi:hypothetical protein